MQKITSFTIDHLKLQPGVYVSRKDPVGDSLITTFDIRMTSPNEEPVMNTAEVHTIEHLGATFLRNHPDFGSKTIYFGPMGCRTGFYLLLAGDYTSGTRRCGPGLRELPGHEPVHGKLPGQPLPDRSLNRHQRRPPGIPGINTFIAIQQ